MAILKALNICEKHVFQKVFETMTFDFVKLKILTDKDKHLG